MVEQEPREYWKSLSQRDDGTLALPIAGDEFPAPPATGWRGLSRRDFLAAAGFTFGSVVMTGCNRAPVEKAIPYLVQPEEILPGRSTYYASTCGACGAGCGMIVTNRDGRAIKLEGNPEHPLSRGGLCAIGQASVLGVYDGMRLRQPLRSGTESTWKIVDEEIAGRLRSIRSDGGAIRFLTRPITSPTTRRVIDKFLGEFPDARHVSYDVLSSSAIYQAHERTHGQRVLPRFLFDKAEVIASFDADFLGTWISPVAHTAAWREGRQTETESSHFSHHVQFEGRLSLTGAKADERVRLAPAELGLVMSHLADTLARKAGEPFDATGLPSCPIDAQIVTNLADRLWHARGKSLVVCGSQDVNVQVVCNFINHVLGNYGATVDLAHPAGRHDAGDDAIQTLLSELASGSVAALLIDGVNPVYDLPNGAAFAAAMAKVPTVISFADRADETSKLASFVCPDHHYLEAWGDVAVGSGVVGLRQPTMRPLFETRSMLESLSLWTGGSQSARELVQETWNGRFPWDQAVHDGFARVAQEPVTAEKFRSAAVAAIRDPQKLPEGKLALILYSKVSMIDGRHASNPWLQEMPDPISKVVWDNYACLSESKAKQLGLKTGDVVRCTVSGSEATAAAIELPILVQPGQHDEVVAIALGYGRADTERFANIGPKWIERKPTLGDNGLVGSNAAGLLSYRDGTLRLCGATVSIAPTGARHVLALTQDYHNIEVPESLTVPGMNRKRSNIRETTLASYLKDGSLGHHGPHHEYMGELWPEDHPYDGHHWGMVIDLTACTGCAACVVSCQVENNVPVVGRDEVRRKRIMHWLRIDRYYSEQPGGVEVSHQPMMCHHCDHAPCETVCPVLATVHSEEGLNQQVYNRCVGTRYCANNCPFKVRRFNWFEYAHDDKLANMSLNPDVTVRSRGVVEKCSFCVQRIEAARAEAKQQGRAIADGDIQPACQQSCSARAIVFGDMNDPESAVSKLIASGRHFRILEELNIRPSVGYLGLIRNRDEGKDDTHHG